LRAGGVGLAGGLAVITHPVVLPYFVVLCLWLFGSELHQRIRQGKSSKRFFRRTLPSGAALCLGFAMVTIPVAWGSYRLTGSFSFLPSFGGLNFYIGNMPDSEALNQVRPGMDWEVLVLTPIREGGVRGGVAGEQAWFYQQSLGWLRREPLSFMGNLLGKTPGFFTSREIPNNVNLYLMRRWSAILQVLVWRIGPWGFPFGLLFPLAVVGWVARFRKIPLPVHLFVILFPVAVILVFNSARNRLPITPVVIILAAAGIVSLADWLRRREWKPLLVAGAALTGLVLLTALPGPFPRERIDSEAEMHYILGNYALKERRAEEAANHYLRSLALRPQHGATHMNLGLAMLCAGRDGETARRALERAVALNPQSADARLNLATLYLDLGMRDKALEQYKEALSAHPLLLERDPGVRRMFADD
ncbi:MAG: tetratricopeptide repeat protein, partial [Candidatus Sumerlaeota bacterium]